MKDMPMTPRLFRHLGLIAALFTASCQALPATPTAQLGVASATVLTGRAVFPGYGLRAVSGDVTGQATVSLIDATGATRAAGVTDAEGRFTLYQPTTPFVAQPGEAYSLVVTKRVGSGLGAPLLSMRTGLLRTSSGWDSYTGATVLVNVATTALAKLAEQDPTLLPATLMGKVTNGAIAPVAPHTADELTSLEAAVRANLTHDADPSGAIVKTGDFYINSAADLAQLANVEILEGNLTIDGDESLSAVALPALRRVTGQLTIDGSNASLHDLRGLGNLERAGSVYISFTEALESLAGLEKLAVVDEDLTVYANAELATLVDDADPAALTGLVGLEQVGGSLGVTENPSLTRLGFPALASVGQDLDLSNDDQLGSLAGLERLSAIAGDLTITGAGLTELAPLAGLTRVGGELSILSTGIGGLGDLASLTTVGALTILNNPELTGLTGLSALTRVEGDVDIRSNSRLVVDCANPLGHLYTYGGRMIFVFNATDCQ